jgi:hypothetical protein
MDNAETGNVSSNIVIHEDASYDGEKTERRQQKRSEVRVIHYFVPKIRSPASPRPGRM